MTDGANVTAWYHVRAQRTSSSVQAHNVWGERERIMTLCRGTHVETRSQCLQYGRYLLLAEGREWIRRGLRRGICSRSGGSASGCLCWGLGSGGSGGLLGRCLCSSHRGPAVFRPYSKSRLGVQSQNAIIRGTVTVSDAEVYYERDVDGGVALAVRWDEDARRSRGKMGEVTAESRAPAIYETHVRT